MGAEVAGGGAEGLLARDVGGKVLRKAGYCLRGEAHVGHADELLADALFLGGADEGEDLAEILLRGGGEEDGEVAVGGVEEPRLGELGRSSAQGLEEGRERLGVRGGDPAHARALRGAERTLVAALMPQC